MGVRPGVRSRALSSIFCSHSSPKKIPVSQLPNGLVQYWMPGFGSNLGQWFEHETALVHCGMGNGQGGRVHTGLVEEQDVDIDFAGSFWLDPMPAHGLLDRQEGAQEMVRPLFGIEGDRAVQEPGLIGEFDGFGFVERRYGSDFSELAEPSNRELKVGGAISHV